MDFTGFLAYTAAETMQPSLDCLTQDLKKLSLESISLDRMISSNQVDEDDADCTLIEYHSHGNRDVCYGEALSKPSENPCGDDREASPECREANYQQFITLVPCQHTFHAAHLSSSIPASAVPNPHNLSFLKGYIPPSTTSCDSSQSQAKCLKRVLPASWTDPATLPYEEELIKSRSNILAKKIDKRRPRF
ncbi:hypothetical protein NM688_g1597 [Phlebia brevispora]|uniref:Uncharacterized protein n=1 Tax=Phlebia brevispora TaxID=194682 RepID=A0ACC1TBA4_9APHY|nr:hypothetical protein NM688_g1597 [Phlebia brevispora]